MDHNDIAEDGIEELGIVSSDTLGNFGAPIEVGGRDLPAGINRD